MSIPSREGGGVRKHDAAVGEQPLQRRPRGERGGRQVLADKTLATTRVYAAEVVRIIDGDTFVARMRTSPGGAVETRVRLRSIDAAELHARCSKELRLAIVAAPRIGQSRKRQVKHAWLVACVLLAASVIAVEFSHPNLLPHPKAAPSYRPYGDVGPDKYPGRIDASVATRSTNDISAAMLSGGFARAYDGGRRGSWCR
jgi:endonuclease YncB( thermonuclease family)